MNPYYIEPANFSQGLSGLVGLKLDRQREDRQTQLELDKANIAADAERAKADALAGKRQEAGRLFREGTIDELGSFMIENPEIGKELNAARKFKNKATEQNAIDTAWSMVTGKKTVPEAVAARAAFVSAQGGDPSDTMASVQDPEMAMKGAQLLLLQKDPKAFKEWRAMQGGEQLSKTDKYKVVGGRLVDISGEKPEVVIGDIKGAKSKTLLDKGLVSVGGSLVDVSDPKNPKAVYQEPDAQKKMTKEKARKEFVRVQGLLDRLKTTGGLDFSDFEGLSEQTKKMLSGADHSQYQKILEDYIGQLQNEYGLSYGGAKGTPGTQTQTKPTHVFSLGKGLQKVN